MVRNAPLAYASRSFNSLKKNYSQLDKEALSILFGVKRFHNYLYGRKFLLQTDHKPLLSILGPHFGIPPLAAARMQRWAIILSAYQYELVFRSTTEHGNADVLSRLFLGQTACSSADACCHSMEFFESGQTLITFKDLQRETALDPILSLVLQRLRTKWIDVDFVSELAPFARRKLELSIDQDLLLWGRRVIVPSKLRGRVLQLLHEDHKGLS